MRKRYAMAAVMQDGTIMFLIGKKRFWTRASAKRACDSWAPPEAWGGTIFSPWMLASSAMARIVPVRTASASRGIAWFRK